MRSYPPPRTEQEFERLCLQFLKLEWNRPRLKLYGKKGEKQRGVDIIDIANPIDCWAAQCKLHESTKTLPPAEIRSEVAKADQFPHPLRHYAICTTGRKTTAAQDTVMELNRERAGTGRFVIELIYWEDMEMRLDADDVFLESYRASSHASVRAVLRSEVTPIVAQIADVREGVIAGATDAVDSELDRAKRLIEEKKHGAARVLLEDLRTRKYDRLTPLQRFRCFANLGAIEFEVGDNGEAGRLMLKAAAEYPQHELAALNRAHGEYLTGNPDGAWVAIQEAEAAARSDHRIAVVYVSYAPESFPQEALLEHVSAVTSHPEVLVALANRCVRLGEFDEAIAFADRVKERGEENAGALLVRGYALAGPCAPDDPRDPVDDPSILDKTRRALEAFESAAVRAEQEGENHLAIRARLVHCDLGARVLSPTDLERSLDEGARLAASRPEELGMFDVMRSQLHLAQGNCNRAIDCARRAVQRTDDVNAHMLLAVAMLNRNEGADGENARRELRKWLPKLEGAGLEQAANILVSDLIASKSWDKTPDLIEKMNACGLESAATLAHEARIALAQDNGSVAREKACAAAAALVSDSAAATRRLVAGVLRRSGALDDAIEVLHPLASRSRLSEDTQHFLLTALEAHRHDLVIDWCGALWSCGALNAHFRWSYLNVLETYDPAAALRVIVTAIESPSDERGSLMARRCLLQRRLGQVVEELKVTDIPDADSVPGHHLALMVEGLSCSGLHAEAVAYAHAGVLRFPDEPAAHAALIRAVLLAPKDISLVTVPAEARVGCAVELLEDGANESKWYTIERERVLGLTDTLGEHEPIARAVLGRKVGDLVILAEGTTGRRTAILRAIEAAALFRFNESMSSWQTRFPDVPFLEQGKLGENAETGELDVSSILAFLNRHVENVKKIDEVYKGGAMSIEFMAEHVGRGFFQAMAHLAFDDDCFVNCVWADEATFGHAVARLENAKGLVLDCSAIWTLRETGLSHILEKLPIPVGVVQQSVDTVQQELADAEKGEGGVVGLDGESLAVMTESAAARAGRASSWREVAAVLARVPRCGSGELAALQVDRREELVSLAGTSNAHTVAAAKERGFLLCTDDRVVEFVAKEFFGVERVWTQTVFAWMHGRGVLDLQSYRRAAALLQARRYTGTWTDENVLVEAARLAQWRLMDQLLIRNLAVLERPSTRPQVCLAMAVTLIRACMTEVSLSTSQVAIVTAIMERVAVRDPSLRIAGEVLRQIPSVMRLVPLQARTAFKVVADWFRTKTRVTV